MYEAVEIEKEAKMTGERTNQGKAVVVESTEEGLSEKELQGVTGGTQQASLDSVKDTSDSGAGAQAASTRLRTSGGWYVKENKNV